MGVWVCIAVEGRVSRARGFKRKMEVSCSTTCRPAHSRRVHHRILNLSNRLLRSPRTGERSCISEAYSKPHAEFFPVTVKLHSHIIY